MSHRPTVYGTRHAVSAGHYLAAAAGFSILEAGGNAIDAGCAAGSQRPCRQQVAASHATTAGGPMSC